MARVLFAMNFIKYRDVPILETVQKPGGILTVKKERGGSTSTQTLDGTLLEQAADSNAFVIAGLDGDHISNL
ncbi:MAG: hypothetical protein ACYCW6_05450 [Candidatus Xenobia bacterium]